MSDKRLFVGTLVMQTRVGTSVTNNIESFVTWSDSENAARGDWVATAFAKHPTAKLDGMNIADITDYARTGFVQ